jgi:hypothetical protein
MCSSPTSKHTYKVYKKTFILNSSIQEQLPDTSMNAATLTSYIGAGQLSTNQPDYFYKGKIYGCKIYQSNLCVREYIPVYDNKNKVYGLFDLVEQKFYGSKIGVLQGAALPKDSDTNEFSALYLGSKYENFAPLTLTNQGVITAKKGYIGNFKVSDKGLFSNDSGINRSVSLTAGFNENFNEYISINRIGSKTQYDKDSSFLEDKYSNSNFLIYKSGVPRNAQGNSILRIQFLQDIPLFKIFLRNVTNQAPNNLQVSILNPLNFKNTVENNQVKYDTEILKAEVYMSVNGGGTDKVGNSLESFTPAIYTNIKAGDEIYAVYKQTRTAGQYTDGGDFSCELLVPKYLTNINIGEQFHVDNQGNLFAASSQIGVCSITKKGISLPQNTTTGFNSPGLHIGNSLQISAYKRTALNTTYALQNYDQNSDLFIGTYTNRVLYPTTSKPNGAGLRFYYNKGKTTEYYIKVKVRKQSGERDKFALTAYLTQTADTANLTSVKAPVDINLTFYYRVSTMTGLLNNTEN